MHIIEQDRYRLSSVLCLRVSGLNNGDCILCKNVAYAGSIPALVTKSMEKDAFSRIADIAGQPEKLAALKNEKWKIKKRFMTNKFLH